MERAKVSKISYSKPKIYPCIHKMKPHHFLLKHVRFPRSRIAAKSFNGSRFDKTPSLLVLQVSMNNESNTIDPIEVRIAPYLRRIFSLRISIC